MSTISRRDVLGFALSAALPLRGENKPLRGIFPIMATPYTAEKAVDYEDLANEVRFLEQCGVHGIVWPQLASEYYKLNIDERMRGMEVVAGAAKGRKPALVLGVQGANTDAALAYLKHAEKLGPDALIAIPPAEANSITDFKDYYRALARATRRPIFIQTTGGAKGIAFETSTILELAREFPNLGYVKEEVAPVIERGRELARHRDVIKSVFSGGGGKGMLYEMRVGFDGTMPGTPYADLHARIWEEYQAGRKEKSIEVFSKLLLMAELEQHISGVRSYIMKKRGVFKTTVSRLRDVSYSPEAIQEIELQWSTLKPYLRA